MTPLHQAARAGHHDDLERLVAAGADVNAVHDIRLDPGGRRMRATPLMVAAGSGEGASLATLELLVKLGADPKLDLGAGTAARFAAGGLGAHHAPGGDAPRLLWLLSLGLDPDETDRRAVTLLAEAAGAGDLARVRVLLDAGARPDPAAAAEYPFQIPLFSAATHGDAEMVRALLAAGARADVLDGQQRTALFVATGEAVKALLAAGLSLEARDIYEWTPLGGAVSDGDLARAEALLAAGANVHDRHDRGFTMFMSAACSMERSPVMMKLLLAAGADPHAVSDLGWNAAHAAIDVNGAEANAEASVRATFTLLAELGVDLELRARDGLTPLDRARACGTPIVVRVLEDLGA